MRRRVRRERREAGLGSGPVSWPTRECVVEASRGGGRRRGGGFVEGLGGMKMGRIFRLLEMARDVVARRVGKGVASVVQARDTARGKLRRGVGLKTQMQPCSH